METKAYSGQIENFCLKWGYFNLFTIEENIKDLI